MPHSRKCHRWEVDASVFYKPNFCCECGEKIEKENRKWWESRKFCDDCAAHSSELKTRIFKSVFGAIVLIGIGFLVASSISEKKPPVVLTRNQAAVSPQQSANTQTAQTTQQPINAQSAIKQTVQAPPKAQTQTLVPAPPQAAANLAQTTEISYYCGARTQKGTPCTRRVRGGGRCWQHIGKPAMLPEEKLRITQ